MKQESNLIPYHTSCLPPGPYLVFAPHPDDESIGMGGTIALAAQEGIRVTVVVLTDGSKAGDFTTRKEEARKAAAVLGISEPLFLGLPDRGLDGPKLASADIEGLIRRAGAHTIFLPSPLDYHPDHRTVTAFVTSLLKKKQDIFDGEIWFYETIRQAEVNRLIDITPVIDKKREAIRAYKSQLEDRPYDELALSMDRVRAFTLPEQCEYAEGFWKCQNNIHSISSLINSYVAPLRGSLDMPLVSIIVRTKDRPKMLKRALASIKRQDYRPLEAVVVNDGGCPLDEDELSGLLSDVKLTYIYLEKNIGRAGAANAGMRHASGKYIGFLDDDDELLPDHISSLVTPLERYDYKVAYGGVEIVELGYEPGSGEMLTTGRGAFQQGFQLPGAACRELHTFQLPAVFKRRALGGGDRRRLRTL